MIRLKMNVKTNVVKYNFHNVLLKQKICFMYKQLTVSKAQL